MVAAHSDVQDGGWTQVTSKPRRTNKGRRSASRPTPPLPFDGPPPIARDVTLAVIRKDFGHKTRAWKESACRQQLRQILERQLAIHRVSLTTAICLAGGSLSRDNWECRKRSMWQIAVFADVREMLASITGHTHSPRRP